MENLLNRAIALARAGDKAAARRLLRQIVAENPQSETAWGWLAHCAETKTERRQALERVVEINPANQRARAALEKMGPVMIQPRPQPPTSPPRSTPKKQPESSTETKRRGCGRTVAIIILVLIIMACLGSLLGGNDSETGKRDKKPSAIGAWGACKEFVKRSLKAPSTAKFPSFDRNFIREFENGNWRASAWVDAQNSFGAMVRSQFFCILRYEDQKWRLIELIIE